MVKKTALVIVAVATLMTSLVVASGCERLFAYDIAETDTDLQIVILSKKMATAEILKVLDKESLRPMELEEFKRFAATYNVEPFFDIGSYCGIADENLDDCKAGLMYYGKNEVEFMIRCGPSKDMWMIGDKFGAMPKSVPIPPK